MRVSIKSKLAALLSGVLVATLALTACGSGTGSSGDGSTSVLKWIAAWGPNAWDPVVAGSTRNALYLAQIYDPLVGLDEDGKPRPQQAEKWEYNEAGDAVTFTLREGLTFTDGTPVDAAAWKAHLERAKTQDNSQLAGDFDSIESVDVIDERTFTINLTQVDYQIPILLSVRGGLIASPTAAEKDLNALNTTSPVGSGPFKVESLVPEASLRLVKNEDYWDADNIHIDAIEISFGNEPTSLVPALQSGAADFAVSNDLSTIDPAEAAGVDVLADYGYGFSQQFIAVNLNKAPFDDPRVVEAVKYAIDRDEFAEQVALGHGDANDQPFPEYFAPYAAEASGLYPFDPKKAQELLAQAGYNTTDKRLSIPFVVMQGTPNDELVQKQLAAVGIDLELSVDPNWSKPYFARDLAITTYGYVGRDSHVQALTANFGGGPLNLSAPHQSAEFQAALKKARETPLDDPDYEKNLEAATVAGVKSSPNVYTYVNPFIYLKTDKLDAPPKIHGQLTFAGVELRD